MRYHTISPYITISPKHARLTASRLKRPSSLKTTLKRPETTRGEHLKGSKTFTAVVARLVSLFGMSMVDCCPDEAASTDGEEGSE